MAIEKRNPTTGFPFNTNHDTVFGGFNIELENALVVEDQVNQDIIPVKDGTVFVDSPFTVLYDNGTATRVVSGTPMTIPSGSLEIGGILDKDGTLIRGVTTLKDSGNSFLASDSITGENNTVPLTQINDEETSFFGVGRMRSLAGTPFITSAFGGTDVDTATVSGTDKIIVEFREVLTAFITGQRFRGTQGKLHYRIIDITTVDGIDTLVYTSEQGEPIDFDATVGPDFEVIYETLNPNFLIKDHLLRLEFFSADGNPMTMKGFPTGPIPPSGDITTFIPFFETKFSVTQDRVIFHNDETFPVSASMEVVGSFDHVVDTSGGALTMTADPDKSKFFSVLDSTGSFTANNCTVDLQVENTRNTPNDSISSFDVTQIQSSNIDTGVSGTRNLVSEGGTPKVFHDGTNWKVITDSETLDFTNVTNRSGLLFFRFLGSKAALSVDDLTQAIDGVIGTKIVVDTIGNTTDPIDSVTGLKLFEGDALSFDDKVVGTTVVLDEDNVSFLFWFNGATWESFQKKFTKADEITFDPANLCIDSTNVQDAIDDSTRSDVLIIRELADLPTPSAGVITLVDNKTYIFENTVDISPNRIVAGDLNNIVGGNRLIDNITTNNAGALITSSKTLLIQNIGFTNTSGDIFDFDGASGTKSLICEKLVISGCDSIGTFNNFKSVAMTGFTVLSTTTEGMLFTGTNEQVVIVGAFAEGWNGTLIDLGTAIFDSVIIGADNLFDVDSGQTVISGAAASANITTGNEGIIVGNVFRGAGTFVDTLDPCDTRWVFRGNTNQENTAVGASVYVADGDEATTSIAMANTPVAVAGTYTEAFACKFTTNTAGLITYIGEADTLVTFSAKYLCNPDISNNIQFSGFVQKNGSGSIPISRDFMIADSVSPVKMVIFGSSSLSQNDTLQLIIENNSGTQDAETNAITFIIEEG